MNDRLPGTTYSNPIWHRGWRIWLGAYNGFAFAHDDFDGADDANDHRYGSAASVEQCKAKIDAYEEERCEAVI